MWGYIATEGSYIQNFNTGFSSTRSDILIHLAQWQYWWWFWFAFLWCFYYLVVARIVRYRSLKMRPKIMTSYRPHGKWGDFLAAIVPVIWCLNILTNSNFILRLLEWQNESSLFTVRVRARQWYWVYKFELKNFTDILSAPKNVGRNKWQINTFGDLQVADDYLHILQLRSQNRWVKSYWSSVLGKVGKVKKLHTISPQEQLRLNFSESTSASELNLKLNNFYLNSDNLDLINLNSAFTSKKRILKGDLINYFSLLRQKKSLWDQKNLGEFKNILSYDFENSKNDLSFYLQNLLNFNFKKSKITNRSLLNNTLLNNVSEGLNYNVNANMYSDFVESSRLVKRTQGVVLPVRLIKYPFGAENIINESFESKNEFSDLFRFRFNDGESTLKHKVIPHTTYLTLKQKRKTKVKTVPSQIRYFKDSEGNLTKKVRYSGKPILFNSAIFEDNLGDTTIYYDLIKKNKKRSDSIPVTLARRILRTKKTLVLPAHVNITLITNSFDIVHSWFVPGLGIKIDCVPGRSTHHTFFIDNVGFYYGQCAEICGRYHHHMPIRLVALPFEHFLVWWHTFGLPKLLFTTSQKRFEAYYAFRKYVW
jgi:hypothetical protein